MAPSIKRASNFVCPSELELFIGYDFDKKERKNYNFQSLKCRKRSPFKFENRLYSHIYI